jgi:hypothetical protein
MPPLFRGTFADEAMLAITRAGEKRRFSARREKNLKKMHFSCLANQCW